MNSQQLLSSSVPVSLPIGSAVPVHPSLDMASLSGPFGCLVAARDAAECNLPWKPDYHPARSSIPFIGHQKRWADYSSSGRPSSEVGDGSGLDAANASLHLFGNDSQQRWADLSSSGFPSADLDNPGEAGSSPAGPPTAVQAHRAREDSSVPARPSMLGQFRCIGFNTTANTTDSDDAWDARPLDLAVASGSQGSPGSVSQQQCAEQQPLTPFAPLPSVGSDTEPPARTVRGFSSSVSPGIQLRVSVPVDDDVSGKGAPRQGYAGLLNLINLGTVEHGASSRSEPHIEAVCTGAVDHAIAVKRLLRNAANGMRAQQEPVRAREGMGGTYFLKNEDGKMSAIFKPCDEEPLAPNNPKGWEGRAMGRPGMKPSVRVGEAAFREVAAYLLDHNGFAGVPAAALAQAWHPVLNYKVRVTKVESLMDISQLNASHMHSSSPRTCAQPMSRQVSMLAATSDNLGAGSPVADGLAKGGAVKRLPSGIAQALRDEMSRNQTPTSTLSRASREGMKTSASSSALHGAVLGQSKVGSLQQYVTHMCDANDISPSRFSASNVHRIGILDVRIFNCDRHAGNLLVSKPRKEAGTSALQGRLQQDMLQLIPIDHGFSLPEAMDNPYFEWLYWPQASLPFGKVELDYIASLNVEADIAMLRRYIPLLREECLRCLEVTTTVLQMCAAAGLTLFEIGSMMTRSDSLGEQMPSDLEVMCMDAREEALAYESPTAAASQLSGGLLSPRSAHTSALNAGAALAPLNEEEEDTIFELEGDSSSALRALHKHGSGAMSYGVGTSDDGFLSRHNSPPSSSSLDSPKLSAGTFATNEVLLTRNGSLPCFTAPSERRFFQRNLEDRDALTSAPPAMLPRSISSFAGGEVAVRVRHKHMERRMWRHKQCARKSKRPVYPPLISGDHPDLVNYVFSGLSAAQWRVFMAAVRDWCEEELAKHTWQQSNDNSAVAGSCPMFSRA